MTLTLLMNWKVTRCFEVSSVSLPGHLPPFAHYAELGVIHSLLWLL